MDNRFVNLGEYKAGCTKAISKKPIPTLPWQSGASESATLRMFC